MLQQGELIGAQKPQGSAVRAIYPPLVAGAPIWRKRRSERKLPAEGLYLPISQGIAAEDERVSRCAILEATSRCSAPIKGAGLGRRRPRVRLACL